MIAPDRTRTSTPTAAPTRAPNRRGEGLRLREEILQATTRMLVTATARDAVTLRAIARETGIAAPSIYKHFADRDAVLDAVVARAFAQLEEACVAAANSSAVGGAKVQAVGRAYVEFALSHPAEYRVMFERTVSSTDPLPVREYPAGTRAFQQFIDAFVELADDTGSPTTEPVRDAQALWASLHGVVTLVPATPGFPWVDPDLIVDRLLSTFVDGVRSKTRYPTG